MMMLPFVIEKHPLSWGVGLVFVCPCGYRRNYITPVSLAWIMRDHLAHPMSNLLVMRGAMN